MPTALTNVCFSNRPFRVKRFQTIHHYSVDVARGLALLFGIGTKALPSWDSKTRWNNLLVGLTVRLLVGLTVRQTNDRSKQTYELTSSIVPRGTSFHRSGAPSFLLSYLILCGSHAAATSLIHRID